MQEHPGAFVNFSGQPDLLHSFTLMDANVCMEVRRWDRGEKVVVKPQFCFLLWPLPLPICDLKLYCNSDRSLLTMPSSSLSGRIINEAKSRWLIQKGSQTNRRHVSFSPSRPPFLCSPGCRISRWAFLKAYYSQDVIWTIWLSYWIEKHSLSFPLSLHGREVRSK